MSRRFVALALLAFTSAAHGAEPKPLWSIEVKADHVEDVRVYWLGFTPDGTSLIARSGTRAIGLVGVWDTETRKLQRQLKCDSCADLTQRGTRDAILPDGKVLLRGFSARELTPDKGTDRAALPPRGKVAYGVWHCPGTKQVVWALSNGDEELENRGNEIVIVPAGATAETLRNKPVPLSEIKATVGAIAVSADASRVAFCAPVYDEQFITLRALTLGENLTLPEVARVPTGHRGVIAHLEFSPNGKTIATGSADSAVFLWDVEKAGKDWKPRAELACGKYRVRAQVFHPDGRTLYALTGDKKGSPNLFVIDVASGKLVAKHALGGQVLCAAFTADSKALVTGDFEGRIAAWDAEALRKP